MKNGNNDISSLEEQMANNDDICCSCGIVTAFPKAFSTTTAWRGWA